VSLFSSLFANFSASVAVVPGVVSVSQLPLLPSFSPSLPYLPENYTKKNSKTSLFNRFKQTDETK